MREKRWVFLAVYGILLATAVSGALKAPRPKFKIATTSTTTGEPEKEDAEEEEEEVQVTTVATDVNATTDHVLTGIPQIDYIWDPNLPRELNGYNLSDYPFYSTIPEKITFKCDGLHDGFYASVAHKCQVYHHCLYGTRYDFLCANFTAFDQRTFICHFASEVDCANSKNFWYRNDALYKATTTSTTSTTTTSTAAPPPRVPPRDSIRRRPLRRRPAYDYYEDYEEEDYDRTRPRGYDRRDDYEYEDRKYRRDRDRDYRDRDAPRARDDRDRDPSRARDDREKDRDYRDRDAPRARDDRDKDVPRARDDRDRDAPRARDDRDKDVPMARDDRDKDVPRARDDRDKDVPRVRDDRDKDRELTPRERFPSRSNRRDPVRGRTDPVLVDDEPRPSRGRDRNSDDPDSVRPLRDEPVAEQDDRRRDGDSKKRDDDRYSDRRYKDDYDDKGTAAPAPPPAAGNTEGLVKPSAPSSSVYARPRTPPKIRRPVPLSEQNKFAYNIPAKASEKPDEPRRRPVDSVDDDYYEDELEEVRPRRPIRRRPAFRERDRDRDFYDGKETRERDRPFRTRYQEDDEDARPRKRPDQRPRNRFFDRDRDRDRRPSTLGRSSQPDRDNDRGRSSPRSKDSSESVESTKRPSFYERTTGKPLLDDAAEDELVDQRPSSRLKETERSGRPSARQPEEPNLEEDALSGRSQHAERSSSFGRPLEPDRAIDRAKSSSRSKDSQDSTESSKRPNFYDKIPEEPSKKSLGPERSSAIGRPSERDRDNGRSRSFSRLKETDRPGRPSSRQPEEPDTEYDSISGSPQDPERLSPFGRPLEPDRATDRGKSSSRSKVSQESTELSKRPSSYETIPEETSERYQGHERSPTIGRDNDQPRSFSRSKDSPEFVELTGESNGANERINRPLSQPEEPAVEDDSPKKSERPSYSERPLRPVHRSSTGVHSPTNLSDEEPGELQDHRPDDEEPSEYYDDPESFPVSSPRSTVRVVKRPFLPSRGGNPNPRGLRPVGSRVPGFTRRDEEERRPPGSPETEQSAAPDAKRRLESTRASQEDSDGPWILGRKSQQVELPEPRDPSSNSGSPGQSRGKIRHPTTETNLYSATYRDKDGPSVRQNVNDVDHPLRDIPESEYDVTLNDALTPSFQQEATALPSGFVLPLHRQISLGSSSESSPQFPGTRQLEKKPFVPSPQFVPETTRALYSRQPEPVPVDGGQFRLQRSQWQDYTGF